MTKTPGPKRSSAKAKGQTVKKTRISSPERRESIVLAAREVFMKLGFAGARTKEIAAQAEINEALIYRHFASKEDLFDAAIIEPLERWMAEYHHLGGLIAMSDEPEAQLNLLKRTLTEYIFQVNSILPLLGIALFGREHHGAEFYRKRIVPVIDRWAALTQKALTPDTLGASLDPHFLARAGLGIAFFLAADARFRDVPFDEEKLGQQLAEFWLPIYEHRRVKKDPAEG